MSELISVIVPVYNVEQYLEKCVKSIINQTYKNLEIILVDDGSTDNSGKICDNLSSMDNRIKVIHKENGGLSSARNVEMKIVSGKYIAFVDSDDVIISNFYEHLYNMLIKYDADIAEAEFLRISSEEIDNVENILKENNKNIKISEVSNTGKEAIKIIYGIKEDPYVKKVVVWNKLYKKELLDNIMFPEGKLHEDEFTTHKILYRANKIVSSNMYIYGYIQTKSSIMRKEIAMKRIEDNLGASLSAMKFFDENKFLDIIPKIMIRYLSNCIELSGKINKENSSDRKEKLDVIEHKYIEFYNNINIIEKNINAEYEDITVDLLKRAYKSVLEKHNLYDFWNELSTIIK